MPRSWRGSASFPLAIRMLHEVQDRRESARGCRRLALCCPPRRHQRTWVADERCGGSDPVRGLPQRASGDADTRPGFCGYSELSAGTLSRHRGAPIGKAGQAPWPSGSARCASACAGCRPAGLRRRAARRQRRSTEPRQRPSPRSTRRSRRRARRKRDTCWGWLTDTDRAADWPGSPVVEYANIPILTGVKTAHRVLGLS